MLTQIIITFGYLGIAVAVFAESGLLIGFFLPGDSLLFTAGLLASQGSFNIIFLIIFCIIAAIAGDSFGYFIGHKFGRKLFRKPDSLLFRQEFVTKTEAFYTKHGKKTVILARFVPIVRTFAPVMAGVGRMSYKTFLSYNIIGGIVWTAGFLWLSYWLGRQFPVLQHYLSIIVIIIVILSVIPIILDFYKNRKAKQKAS